MIVTRRRAIGGGGAFLAALLIDPARSAAGATTDIMMQGEPDGSHVWFDPIGLHIAPGKTIRWTNRDPANSHTATAYHPDVMDRPLRIPRRAKPWDSDYLLPGESFSMTLDEPGVYDFYCIPHEHAGMVGRIVVGRPDGSDWRNGVQDEGGLEPLPEVALKAFPSVEEIIREGFIRRM